jgi:hypothetical protein
MRWDAHWEHVAHAPPKEEKAEYAYQNIRTKNFWWGDGDKVSLCLAGLHSKLIFCPDPVLERQGQLPQEGRRVRLSRHPAPRRRGKALDHVRVRSCSRPSILYIKPRHLCRWRMHFICLLRAPTLQYQCIPTYHAQDTPACSNVMPDL